MAFIEAKIYSKLFLFFFYKKNKNVSAKFHYFILPLFFLKALDVRLNLRILLQPIIFISMMSSKICFAGIIPFGFIRIQKKPLVFSAFGTASWTVPSGVTSFTIKAWGAGGGNSTAGGNGLVVISY